jgi:hypothetical protein
LKPSASLRDFLTPSSTQGDSLKAFA